MKRLLFFFMVLLIPISLYSQADTQPHIHVKAGIKQNEVRLRWAVDQANAWQKANTSGFTLKRYTLVRDGKTLTVPEEKNLGQFFPAKQKEWEIIVDKNDYAAIVAQSLFGDSFEVELGNQKQGELESILNKSQELEQRFAYALMAADLDFDVATLAGWGYIDKTVIPNERYVYIVNTNQEVLIEKGEALAIIEDKDPELPKPLDFIGIFQDKSVLLSWEYLQLRDVYTSYFIERSNDGKSFSALSDLPVMNMNSQAQKESNNMVFVDSLQVANQPYSYRIRGKTIFGDYGPYSSIVSGEGRKKLEVTPRIKSARVGDDDKITLEWDFPKENEVDIQSFELLYSPTDKENEYKVTKNKLSSDKRSVIVKSESSSNYYKIRAVGKNNDHRESFSVLVQPEDNTPPAIPIQLKAKIDSTGIAHIEWKPNTEADLEGYHIFRGNQKGEELMRITTQPIKEAVFNDSVQLANLNSKVYYYVTAVDFRKNQSEPSEIIEVDKPDIIPPQNPTFSKYEIKDGVITLDWYKSVSEDVTLHQLYRIDIDEPNAFAKKIYETKELTPTFSFQDKELQSDKRYIYFLKAIDKSNLISKESQRITLRNVDLRPKKVISNLTGTANQKEGRIDLIWKNQVNDITEIVIYRQKEGEKSSLLTTLNGQQNYLEDKNVTVGTKYTYLIKAMLSNNQPSTTEKITVEY
jgi:uncharacterized protein